MIRKGLQILEERGIQAFLRRSSGFIYKKTVRPYLLISGYWTENSARVQKKAPLDRYFWPDNVLQPHIEDGIVSIHKSLTTAGDSVVIVGGGDGVTAVNASTIVGETGDVTIYEGGEESVNKIERVIRLNDIQEICKVCHAVVESECDVFGGDVTEAAQISADEIPECDVLELDCEGSEYDILSKLVHRPRLLIIELHPYNFSVTPEELMTMISNLGYQVMHRYGHDGTPISEDEFFTLLQHSNEKGDELKERSIETNRGQTLIESDARWPVVIGAVHNPV